MITTHEPLKKILLLSIESWLFNRDPYKGLSSSLQNWVGLIPNKSPKKPFGPFFHYETMLHHSKLEFLFASLRRGTFFLKAESCSHVPALPFEKGSLFNRGSIS